MTHRIRLAVVALLLAAGVAHANPGARDPSFAGGRGVRLGFGGGPSISLGMTPQPDGKLILVGTAREGNAFEAALARYQTDGTLDPAFGTGGITRLPYTITSPTGVAPTDQSTAVAMYDATRFVTAGHGGTTASASNFVVTLFKADGTPDSTFGIVGRVITDLSGDLDRPAAIAVQADGKIVVAGTIGPTGSGSIGVVRYTASGGLDNTFDGDGIATYSYSANHEEARGMAIQPDGKIVVAGYAFTAPGELDVLVLRFGTNGLLDGTFSGDGVVTTDLPNPSADFGSAVAVQTGVSQPVPKIVVAGGSSGSLLVLRYLDNGNLDATFNGVGYRTIPFGSHAESRGVAVQSLSGDPARIVVCGDGQSDGGNHILVARMFLDGAPDNAFDGDGFVATPLNVGYASAIQIVSGRVVVAGQSSTLEAQHGFTSLRYEGSGALDPTWDGDGIRFDGFGDEVCVPRDVAVQADGKIVAVGAARESPSAQLGFGLMRLNRDGTPDPTFGGDGRVIAHPAGPSAQAVATAVAMQPDGRIVVAGVEGSGDVTRVLLARFLANGDPDPSFDGDGFRDGLFFGQSEYANDVLVEPGGRIVVAGRISDGRDGDFLLLRFLPGGGVDTGFDGDGARSIDFGSVNDEARAVALQEDGKLVVAGTMHNGADTDFALARVHPNGAPDFSFRGIGHVTTHLGGSDEAYDLAVLPDGRIVLAGESGGATSALALARYTSSGFLDSSFDGDGIAVEPVFNAPMRHRGPDAEGGAAPQSAYGRDLSVLPNEKLLLSGYVDFGSGTEDFLVARFESDGQLDESYGDLGGFTFVNVDRGYPDLEPRAALDDSGRIVLVGDSDGVFGFVRLLGDAPGLVAAEETPPRAARLALGGAHPFRGGITLIVDLPESAEIGLDVFDVAGARVRSLAAGTRVAGRHRFEWDGSGESAGPFGAGVYFARLRAAGETFVAKLVKLD